MKKIKSAMSKNFETKDSLRSCYANGGAASQAVLTQGVGMRNGGAVFPGVKETPVPTGKKYQAGGPDPGMADGGPIGRVIEAYKTPTEQMAPASQAARQGVGNVLAVNPTAVALATGNPHYLTQPIVTKANTQPGDEPARQNLRDLGSDLATRTKGVLGAIGLADGGTIQSTAQLLANRGKSIDAQVDAAVGPAPTPTPAKPPAVTQPVHATDEDVGIHIPKQVPTAPPKRSGLFGLGFMGLRDGGGIYKLANGGWAPSVPSPMYNQESAALVAGRSGGVATLYGSGKGMDVPDVGRPPSVTSQRLASTATPDTGRVSVVPSASNTGGGLRAPLSWDPLRGDPAYQPATNYVGTSAAQPANDDAEAFATGGPVKGPGGPTDDKVPAMLSHGEYVLPADTVKAVGKGNLDNLRSATHTFVSGKQPSQMANGSPDFITDANGNTVAAPPNVEVPAAGEAAAPQGLFARAGAAAARVKDAAVNALRSPAIATDTAPVQGITGRVAGAVGRGAYAAGKGVLGAYAKVTSPVAGIGGGIQSLIESQGPERGAFDSQATMSSPGPFASAGLDALRTIRDVGDAATFGMASKFGNYLAGNAPAAAPAAAPDPDPQTRDKLRTPVTAGGRMVPGVDKDNNLTPISLRDANSAGGVDTNGQIGKIVDPKTGAPTFYGGVGGEEGQRLQAIETQRGQQRFANDSADMAATIQGKIAAGDLEGANQLAYNGATHAMVDKAYGERAATAAKTGSSGDFNKSLVGMNAAQRASAIAVHGQQVQQEESVNALAANKAIANAQLAEVSRGHDLTYAGNVMNRQMQLAQLQQQAALANRSYGEELDQHRNDTMDKAISGVMPPVTGGDGKVDLGATASNNAALKTYAMSYGIDPKKMSSAQLTEAMQGPVKTSFDMNNIMNASNAKSVIGGHQTPNYDPMASSRTAEVGDLVHGLPLSKELWSKLQVTDPRIITTKSGRVGLASELFANQNGHGYNSAAEDEAYRQILENGGQKAATAFRNQKGSANQ